MMNHDDSFQQISDYVLGVLPTGRMDEVESHILSCKMCQQALARERSMERMIQDTLAAASTPDPSRLQLLMPPVPRSQVGNSVFRGMGKRLQPAFIILLLLLGGLMINGMLPTNNLPGLVVTAHAATATSTKTPTATSVQPGQGTLLDVHQVSLESVDAVIPPSVKPPNESSPVGTPGADPTPVAAIPQPGQ